MLKKGILLFSLLTVLGFSGCISMIAGSAVQAAMMAEVQKTYDEKTDADSVLVKIPLAKIPTGAMLMVERLTPKKGGAPNYSITVEYSDANSSGKFESLAFLIDGERTNLKGFIPDYKSTYTNVLLRGNVWLQAYLEENQQIADLNVKIDPKTAETLIKKIQSAKTIVIKNFRKDVKEPLSYTLTPEDQALFKNF